MSINRENCEAFFLDYYEGNLSKEGVEELFSFLVLNPEMRDVFDSYEGVSFSPDKQIHFEGKADLKKKEEIVAGINASNYEEYFVSEVEGLLSAEEKTALENFIALHPEKRGELDLLRKAILVPDENIVFEHKASLMKSVLVSEANFDEMAISSMEGLLNAAEEKAFVAALAGNVENQKTFSLYKQTKLSPDTSVVFEDKASLKHDENDRGAFWWARDIRFAAAAAVILFIGIFYWNKSVNNIETNGTLVKNDTTNSKKQVFPTLNPNDKMATNGTANNIPKNSSSNGNPNHQKQNANNVLVPSSVQNDKTNFVAIASNKKDLHLENNLDTQVEFTDAYYNYAFSESNSPVVDNDISLQQAVMRWMKKKLDHNSIDNPDEEAVYATYASNNNNPEVSRGDVTGFDITSSAVNRLGQATGANLHLGKEPEGTILTVGKYHLWLNRN